MFGRRARTSELAAVLEAVAGIIEETRKTFEAGAAHALRVPEFHRQVDLKPEDSERLDDALGDNARAHVLGMLTGDDPDKMAEWMKRGTHRELRTERTGD